MRYPLLDAVTMESYSLGPLIPDDYDSQILPVFSAITNITGYGWWLYTEKASQEITRDLIHIVARLHLNGVCHKDIKPTNMRLNKHPEPSSLRRVALPHETSESILSQNLVPPSHEDWESEKYVENFESIAGFLWNNVSVHPVEMATPPPEEHCSEFADNLAIFDFNTAESIPEAISDPTKFKVYDSQGTSGFLPPECLDPKCKQKIDDLDIGFDAEKRDMWAIGISLYCLLFGRPPFWSNSAMEGLGLIFQVISKDTECVHPAACPHRCIEGLPNYSDTPKFIRDMCETCTVMFGKPFISPLCSDFIQQILHKNPAKRLSAHEALQHPWLMDGVAT
eukprot:GHVH01006296.1.p1 GENE.GHVH01006296.1~~GHVH01006296.1.p1  ORF type:complete len:337 (+),score=27.61 GHVH01006296.1:546-1556(+)